MPFKILIVLILLLIGTGLFVAEHVMFETLGAGFFIGLALRAALIFGLLMGSEGARMILMVFAVIGLFLSALAFVALFALPVGLGAVATVAWSSVILSVVSNGFIIHALRDTEVQKWMLRRSLGADVVD